MAGTLEFQGGSTAAVLAYTGAARQMVIDTDHWQGRIMDGTTAGGILIGGARQDAQSGTTYTIVTADQGKIVTFNNGSAVAVTLPQAGSSGGAFMPNQTGFLVLNLGVGIVTITPTTSTINGNATLTLNQGDGARIISNGTNYLAIVGRTGSGASPGGGSNAIQYNAGGGALGGVSLAAGQILVGTTSAPIAGTIAAGTNVSISNSGGTITINASTGGGTGTGLWAPIMGSVPTDTGTGFTTWVNQGGASVSNASTGIALSVPAAGASNNLRCRVTTGVPSTPYTRKALIAFTGGVMEGISMGVGWYDGSNKIQVIAFEYDGSGNPGVVGLVVLSFSNPTTFNANHFNGFGKFPNIGPPIWFQIADDGTNVSFAWGLDGTQFYTLYSVAKASGYLGSSGYSNFIFYGNAYENFAFTPTLMAFN